MRYAAWMFAILLPFSGGEAMAQGRDRNAALDGLVFAELDRLGVPRDTVTKILYQRRVSGGDNSSRLTGIDAYLSLTTCEQGSLIIGMDPNGGVREVYTRRGCEVAGVDSTC